MKMVANISGEPTSGLTLARLQPQFTDEDYSIIRRAVGKLSGHEQTVVVLKFWKNCSLIEIAEILELGRRDVERYLRNAISKLKTACLEHRRFSRSQSVDMAEAA